ncbi:MAG: penicillin-binding protein 2 [Acidobacteriota bacterium]|nr:penicillin-binding protein 2 [Acidobacteriota bacterium]MDH3522299.1 penicillin-binding protein 2 [Acidobacteriota bacterium]
MKRVREERENLVSRIPRLQVFFAALMIIIATGYWRVQVVGGDFYRGLAENNRLRRVPIKAPRGLIYDRDDRLLVDNVPSYNLLLDGSRSANVERALAFAAAVLEREPSELRSAVERHSGRSRFEPVLLAENLTLADVSQVSVAQLEYPEFEIDVEHLRLYRHGPLTAHALGYLGEATEEDLARRPGAYQPGDLVGRKGMERVFDLHLRGRDGERELIVDSRGRTREEHGREAAVAGKNLHLTLDLELQQEAARYLGERAGAAVALDPRSGEVLMLVSAPSYNPNLFTRRLDDEQWRELIDSPYHPLQNRTIQNAHPPGSVFKMVLAVAGLSEGTVSPTDSVFCSGSTTIYNRRNRCWLRRGHGWVNLRKAIKESCDVYFYHLGQKLGINRIAHYARLFGLGGPTGFDIPGEKAGLIPDTEWSLARRGSPWYPGETISVAIGQGPILVTPLQLAGMTAALANGGRLVRPHLARGGRSAPSAPIAVDPDAIALVREAMWAVVNEEHGTGSSVRLPYVQIAGKTGTAQVVEQRTWTRNEDLPEEHRDHAWFVSFAPVDDPRLVVVAFVEHGGHGSDAAAPLAKRIYESYFGDPDPR